MRIREHYEQLYSHKFDNVDEMEPIRKSLQITKLTPNETDNFNCPITIKFNSLSKLLEKKSISPDISIGKFCKHLQK